MVRRKPFMPMYWGDFIADTMELDARLTGAYLMLIAHYWQHGGLPDDDRELARISRLSRNLFKKFKPVLQKYFHHGWHHKRIDFELERAEDISRKRVVAGSKGGARRKQLPPGTRAIAPIPHKSPTTTETLPRARGKRSAEELGLTPSAELTETLAKALALKDRPP